MPRKPAITEPEESKVFAIIDGERVTVLADRILYEADDNGYLPAFRLGDRRLTPFLYDRGDGYYIVMAWIS